MLACAVAILVAAEWPRLEHRFGVEGRRTRDRAREQGDEDPAHERESTDARREVGADGVLERGLRFRYVWPIEAP